MKNQKGIINITIVVIIVVITSLMIGAAWWYESNKEEDNTNSNITQQPSNSNASNKNTYSIAEPVIFTVNKTFEVCDDGFQPIYRIVRNGKNILLKHSCSGFAGSGSDQYCENGKIVTERVVGGCSDLISCNEITVNETFTWDQQEYVQITEQCDGQKIRHEIQQQAPAGKYKIMIGDEVIKEFAIIENASN